MKRILLITLGTVTLLASGCSANFQMPWDKNLLDPGRIATREPLEIPPDLNTLPPPEKGGPMPRGASKEVGRGENATTILFGKPSGSATTRPAAAEAAQTPPPGPQNMPDWVSNPTTEPEKKPSRDNDSPVPPGRKQKSGSTGPW